MLWIRIFYSNRYLWLDTMFLDEEKNDSSRLIHILPNPVFRFIHLFLFFSLFVYRTRFAVVSAWGFVFSSCSVRNRNGTSDSNDGLETKTTRSVLGACTTGRNDTPLYYIICLLRALATLYKILFSDGWKSASVTFNIQLFMELLGGYFCPSGWKKN